jgi:hypothetical protein
MKKRRLVWAAVVTLLSLTLIAVWTRQITASPIDLDAMALLQMGINLERHGVLSTDTAPPFAPSNYREPAPAVVSALAIRAIDAVMGPADPSAYYSGIRLRLVKYQNLLWLGIASFAAAWAAWTLTGSRYLGLLAVLLVNIPYRWHLPFTPVDDLMSELPAASLLLLASSFLTVALVRSSIRYLTFAGLAFGVLTLTKAMFLYVFIVLVGLLAAYLWYQRARIPPRRAVLAVGAFVVAFGCTAGAWMYRNHVQLGTWEITQRAGLALYERSRDDQMSTDEYIGAWYAWAPSQLQPGLGHLLGFSPRDLERGGRLQRFNEDLDSGVMKQDLVAVWAGQPERTVTFFGQAWAERVKLEAQLRDAARPHWDIEADKVLEQLGIAAFLAHPWRHAAVSIAQVWRGAAWAAPVLIAAVLLGVLQRCYALALFALPALGMVMLYALATAFFGRYGIPARSTAAVALAVIAKALWDRVGGTHLPACMAADNRSLNRNAPRADM